MVEKFRGAVIGFAVGDALGMPVEGMKREDIKRYYGKISDFVDSPLGDLKAGEWTDDTEQMIILANSILKTRTFSPEQFAKDILNLRSNRIGWTTRRALKNLSLGCSWINSGVESETCGSSVRVLPIGLVYSFNLDLVEEYSALSSCVTHKGIAIAGAIAFGIGIACVYNGMDHEEVVREVQRRVRKYDELIADKIRLSYDISDKDVDFAIDKIGNSVSVYESVPLAFYLFFSTSDFEECAVKSANVGGDADSISAMACALKGCERGISDIPNRWIRKLKDCDYLMELADRLYDLKLILEFI